MSKEQLSTPVIDTYRGDGDFPKELPEHLQNYGDIRFDPAATPAEKASHEAEMARVWATNKGYDELFTAVDLQTFEKAHDAIMVEAMKVEVATQELVTATGVNIGNRAVRRQVNLEIGRALDKAAAAQAEKLLPIHDLNHKDKEKIERQRAELQNLLTADVIVRNSGAIFKRQPAEFAKHIADWRKYEQLGVGAEVEMLHAEALRSNELFNPKEHKVFHDEYAEKMSEPYGRLFSLIRDELPIDRYHIPLAGGKDTSLNKVSAAFVKDQKEVMADKDVKKSVDKKDVDRVGIANRLLAVKHLSPVLKAIEEAYRAQGMDGDPLKQKMDEANTALQNWLIDEKVRKDFNHYDLSMNTSEMRAKKAGKAGLRFSGLKVRTKAAKQSLPPRHKGYDRDVEYKAAMKAQRLATAGAGTPRTRRFFTRRWAPHPTPPHTP